MRAKNGTRSRPRTGPKADWEHAGADIPPGLKKRLVAEAEKNSVPIAVVIRWALDEYLPGEGEE